MKNNIHPLYKEDAQLADLIDERMEKWTNQLMDKKEKPLILISEAPDGSANMAVSPSISYEMAKQLLTIALSAIDFLEEK